MTHQRRTFICEFKLPIMKHHENGKSPSDTNSKFLLSYYFDDNSLCSFQYKVNHFGLLFDILYSKPELPSLFSLYVF